MVGEHAFAEEGQEALDLDDARHVADDGRVPCRFGMRWV